MARAPKTTAITLDPSQSVEEQLGSLVQQLNSFMTDVHTALDGGLSSENLRRQVKVLTIKTLGGGVVDSTVRFECTLTSRPKDIRPVQIKTVSGTAPSAAPDFSQWFLKPGNVVEFRTINGLAANSKYEVTLFVE